MFTTISLHIGVANTIKSLSSDEQRLFRMYGKLPNKKDLLQNKLKVTRSLWYRLIQQ